MMTNTLRFGQLVHAWRKSDDGTTAVEAAICFPIVLTLMFGCFQYGIFFDKATDLNHNFQDASRQVKLLVDPSDGELMSLYQSVIEESLEEDVTLTVDRIQRYGEPFVQVNMTYTYTIDIPFLEQFPLTSSYQNLVILTMET